MEYHNCNRTPLDRIDENLMKELRELECNSAQGDSPLYLKRESCVNRNVNNSRNFGCDKVNNRTRQNYCVIDNMNINPMRFCGCKDNGSVNPQLSGVPLAMLYSPYQDFDELYELELGYHNGTLFKELDFPFYMASCKGIKHSSCGCGCAEFEGDK